MDPVLSSRLALGSDLYYAGFETADGGRMRAWWVSLDRGELRSVHLTAGGMETDNPGHVGQPKREGGCIVFRVGDRTFALTPTLATCDAGRELPRQHCFADAGWVGGSRPFV